ncbi:MAG: hypothetical protein EA396_09845 [Anaerolineaceae bacterium]|nr:MAG: hypothetical protein EA396_09845 [Anaerolineaceae bacterium]
MNRILYLWLVLAGLIVVACAPPDSGTAEPTPAPTSTAEPSATPVYNNLSDAEATALTFLDFWERGDYEFMYNFISPSSQQAFSYDSFLAAYTLSNREIRLEGVTTAPRALTRQSSRIVTLTYDATFDSALVGQFTDNDRQLQLVLDHELQGWRVAWSPGNIFTEMGGGARLRMDTVQPQRAAIYDREGRILADMNGRIVTVFVIKNEIPDETACLNTLAQAFNQPTDEIQARLDRNDPNWLADLGWIEADSFRTYEADLVRDCDAQFEGRATRRYIHGELYAHIIGNVGYPEPAQVPRYEALGFRQDSIIGVSGIEATWDSYLRGRAGGRLTLVNLNGDILRVLAERGTEPAHSVHLTIDTDLQRYALQRMTEEFATYAGGWGSTSKGGAVIILDVNSGEVLAMVSYPSFNANAFTPFPVMGIQEAERIVRAAENDSREVLLNRVTQGTYPAGSTMKTFSAIAALDSGVYDFGTRYASTGIWNRDIPRRDWLAGGHGNLNLTEALTHSCNTCFYEVGYQMDNIDPYLMLSYFEMMGFGDDVGLRDLPSATGFVGSPDTKDRHHPEPWSFSDSVNIAIGQGMVEVTPLQMAMGYMMIANHGRYYRPQLVRQASLLGESSYQMQPDLMEVIPVRPEIFDYLHIGLCDVTTLRWGTASHIFQWAPRLMEEYGVCGKTGTAEHPRRLPHAWFAGWAPADEPEILVVALVENSGDGSAYAAPIVRDVMHYYFYGEAP